MFIIFLNISLASKIHEIMGKSAWETQKILATLYSDRGKTNYCSYCSVKFVYVVIQSIVNSQLLENDLSYTLTLSWRRLLSYRNQSIDFAELQAPAKKCLCHKKNLCQIQFKEAYSYKNPGKPVNFGRSELTFRSFYSCLHTISPRILQDIACRPIISVTISKK